MPPKVTYTIIRMPTTVTAVLYSSPNSSWISWPAPTIWTMR